MNDEQMEEIKRHFGGVAEGLGHKIQLVAEGVVNLNEKFDREIAALRQEMKSEFSEVKAMIKFSYAELDSRVRAVEETVLSLQARLERLEARQRKGDKEAR